MSTHRKISRRTWLKGMAVFSAAAGMPLVLASTATQAKASKAAVHYQDYPNGMRTCHMCKFFISRGGGRSGMMGCPMGGGMMGDGRSWSLPSSRRQDQPNGLLRPVCSTVERENSPCWPCASRRDAHRDAFVSSEVGLEAAHDAAHEGRRHDVGHGRGRPNRPDPPRFGNCCARKIRFL
jgi:hypothetical protein